MTTKRFELKDWGLATHLNSLSSYGKGSLNFSSELNLQWTGEARTIRFCNRFSIDITPEEVRENPEFQPDEWNPVKSWNIPENLDLMFSIQETESGKEIALLRGYFDGTSFRRPNGEFMNWFCRGISPGRYNCLIKRYQEDEKAEIVSGRFLELVAEYDRQDDEDEE